MIILSLLLWPLYPHSCQPLFLKFRIVCFLCVTSRANAGSVMLTAEERGWTQTCFRDVCKCSADCAVVFLLDGIFYSYFRALRSAGTNRLVVPPVRLATVGSRAFPAAAAHTWNSLPEHIVSASTLQSFKRHLKTFLLQQSFRLAL